MIDKYYTLKEVCKLLSVDRVTLYNWEKKGLISMVRLGERNTRISETELNRFLKERNNER